MTHHLTTLDDLVVAEFWPLSKACSAVMCGHPNVKIPGVDFVPIASLDAWMSTEPGTDSLYAIYKLAQQAMYNGALRRFDGIIVRGYELHEPCVQPREFLLWCQDKGVTVAPPLDRLLQGDPAVAPADAPRPNGRTTFTLADAARYLVNALDDEPGLTQKAAEAWVRRHCTSIAPDGQRPCYELQDVLAAIEARRARLRHKDTLREG